MTIAAIAVAAYLIGSIPFAVIVSRAYGLPDPRDYGSGNPGATNVLRTGSKAAAVLTLLGDAAKGWLAVVLARQLAPEGALDLATAVAAVAVTFGHICSPFLRFRGGKGVSTALGVLLGLDVIVAAGTFATWAIIAFFFRISSLASLVGAAFAPFFSFLLYGMNRLALEAALAVTGISLLVAWRHKTNIRNLLAGREGRIGESAGRTADR